MSHSSRMDEPRATGTPLGLRERKKALTRAAIADAAFALARDRGVDDVTIEVIADRAMVSPRTFSNYFPSKEAAVLHAGHIDPDAVVAGLADRPGDEPPLVALQATSRATLNALTPDQVDALRATEQLVEQNPVLVPFRMAQFETLETAVRRAVATRLGIEDPDAAYPALVAGAGVSAIRTALRRWTGDEHAGVESLAALVEEYFDELEAGLPSAPVAAAHAVV